MTLEIEEKIIAGGGPEDNMIVRHLVLRGSQFDIGKHMAALAINRYEYSAPLSVDPLMSDVKREYIQKKWPTHYLRMQGAAAAFNLDILDSDYDFYELYYSPGTPPPGCSNIYYPRTANGHAMLSRNYDLSTGVDPVSTREPYLMEVYPDEGYSYLSMCAYDLLGGTTDGINSEGLSVALLADLETALSVTDPEHPAGIYDYEGTMFSGRMAAGVSEMQVSRFILETCKNVDEAKRALLTLLSHYRVIPLHYIIGDRHGNGFVFEGSMQGHLPRFIDCNGSALPVTNHPIRGRKVTKHELIDESVGRLEELKRRIKTNDGPIDFPHIKANAESVAAVSPVGEGQYAGEVVSRTLWHSFYDLNERSLIINYYLHDTGDENSPVVHRTSDLHFNLEI